MKLRLDWKSLGWRLLIVGSVLLPIAFGLVHPPPVIMGLVALGVLALIVWRVGYKLPREVRAQWREGKAWREREKLSRDSGRRP